MLETLIQQLGQELQMEEFIVSAAPGTYNLSFDHDIKLDASQSAQGYLIKSIIGPCPKQNLEPFCVKVLEANLFGRGTRGAAIGLNAEGNLLTLSLELDYNSTYREFKEKLEDFVNALDFWREEALKHR
jgi:hypothetical protein